MLHVDTKDRGTHATPHGTRYTYTLSLSRATRPARTLVTRHSLRLTPLSTHSTLPREAVRVGPRPGKPRQKSSSHITQVHSIPINQSTHDTHHQSIQSKHTKYSNQKQTQSTNNPATKRTHPLATNPNASNHTQTKPTNPKQASKHKQTTGTNRHALNPTHPSRHTHIQSIRSKQPKAIKLHHTIQR